MSLLLASGCAHIEEYDTEETADTEETTEVQTVTVDNPNTIRGLRMTAYQ